jgi:hypothetical protein
MKVLMEAVMERGVGCGVAVGRIVGLAGIGSFAVGIEDFEFVVGIVAGSGSVVGTADFDFVGSVDLSFVGIVYSGFAVKTVYSGSAAGTEVDSGSTVGIEGSVGIADSDSVDDAADLERSSVESVTVVVEAEQGGHSVA